MDNNTGKIKISYEVDFNLIYLLDRKPVAEGLNDLTTAVEKIVNDYNTKYKTESPDATFYICSCDYFTESTIIFTRFETDFEYNFRINRSEFEATRQKELRKKQYLLLKKEFEAE
jgi:hypothetical protein